MHAGAATIAAGAGARPRVVRSLIATATRRPLHHLRTVRRRRRLEAVFARRPQCQSRARGQALYDDC